MPEWLYLPLAAGSFLLLLVLFVVLINRCFCPKHDRDIVDSKRNSNSKPAASLQEGIATLHQQLELDSKRSRGNINRYVFRRGISSRPVFNWADHPSLITDAVENGWSRFAFRSFMSSPSTRSSLLGLCAVADYGREAETKISWEVCQGSADFMQKIRLNSGLKEVNASNSSMSAVSVIRTSLPLPGPPLGNSSFPQEAYFEITILNCHGEDLDQSIVKGKEGERTKLIQENSVARAKSESLVHVSCGQRPNKIEELKLAVKEDEVVMLSVGLTTGGSLPLKLPGSYPGSMGFNSDGSVYLDGTKLVFESEKGEWARTDKVIGCGFDPRQKKVFLTVDGELLHEIHCKAEEYGTPLYPTLAANNDIQVLVNFGQCAFRYIPANAHRTPNPCFIGPVVNSPALDYEDSRELFSMGRIDSEWLNRYTTKGNIGASNNKASSVEFDDESEADLFEIVLDSCGKSPNTVMQ